jgi:alkylmercury lyase
LTTGRPPHQRDLPLAGGVDRDEAFRQLREMDLVHLDSDGYVRAAYPFSGRMTGHFVQLGDGLVLSAMCAIDALGIPLMPARDALIVSNDPVGGQPIRMECRGDRWRWSPGGTVVLAAQSRGDGPATDCLCPSITFHTSSQSATDHLRSHPDWTGQVLDQREAIEVARWSFASLLAPEGAA